MFNPPEINVMQLHFGCAAHFQNVGSILHMFELLHLFSKHLCNVSSLVPGECLLVTLGG